ncbi:MAG TPA: hypothetical protein VMZ74_07210 [Ramlibacter sp.]|nr:hypothetical protein [Ramlibacter sp.]
MELANSIITLQPGMYIMRHPQTGMPALSISRAAVNAKHNGQIQALYTPGTDGSLLRDGTDCIVMQVLNAPVDILVTAYLDKAGVAVPALKVDKIRIDGDEAAPKAIEVPKKGLTLIGHVERTGDVLAREGETLGNPANALRLEGFQLVWPDKPQGLDLTYTAKVEGAGPTKTVSTGHFCGTRNAAKRLVGVTFALTGAKASDYELKGRAFFSGGYEADIVSGSALSGPTGMEHLSGIQLKVQPAAGKKGKGAWEASPRTKVFKKAGSKGR